MREKTVVEMVGGLSGVFEEEEVKEEKTEERPRENAIGSDWKRNQPWGLIHL